MEDITELKRILHNTIEYMRILEGCNKGLKEEIDQLYERDRKLHVKIAYLLNNLDLYFHQKYIEVPYDKENPN